MSKVVTIKNIPADRSAKRRLGKTAKKPHLGARPGGRAPYLGNFPDGPSCSRDSISQGDQAVLAAGAVAATLTVTPEVDTEFDSLMIDSQLDGTVDLNYCTKDMLINTPTNQYAPLSVGRPGFCVKARANQPLNFVFTFPTAAAGGEVVSVALTGRRGTC